MSMSIGGVAGGEEIFLSRRGNRIGKDTRWILLGDLPTIPSLPLEKITLETRWLK